MSATPSIPVPQTPRSTAEASTRVPGQFTGEDRQILLDASHDLPGGHAVEFDVGESEWDYAIVFPGFPEDAPARFIVGWSRAGCLSITDCVNGETQPGLTMAEIAATMLRMGTVGGA